MGVAGFMIVFFAIVFFAPEMGGFFIEYNNFLPADPLKTPEHIAPVWYFTPFYSMLRATTDEFTWVLAAGAAIAALVMFFKCKGSAKIIVPVVLLALAVSLRLIDAKFWGVVVMGGAVVLLFFLPWLDYSPVRSIRYRPDWHKWLYGIFFVNFIILGYLGTQMPSDIFNLMSQIGTVIYLAFFFLMPVWSRMGSFKPVPDRVVFHAH
jgi:ubiquinol-cytochrome c reductase cytochrome b subunit